MRRASRSLAYGLIAVIALMTQQAQSQELAPAPPAADEGVVSLNSSEAAAPLPLPSVESAPCDAVGCDATAGTCCDYQPSATCCEVEPYRCCCCGHTDCYMPGIHKRKRNGKLRWCRVWTTGDMYQHYAYYPEHHGYYYFRPYNYTNVLEHKEQVVCLGGDRSAPYSVAMFDRFYDEYYESNPVITPPVLDRTTVPGASNLPRLEELLK